MKRLILILLTIIIMYAFSACDNKGYRSVEASEANFSGSLDINSPEGIAKSSGEIYMKISEGKISVDDAMDKLIALSSSESLVDVLKNKDRFRQGIVDYASYMASNEDNITKIEFAKTIYDNPNECFIERIQYQKKDNKCYYFRQDFVLEEGKWKARGDNPVDGFKIKWGISKKNVLQ